VKEIMVGELKVTYSPELQLTTVQEKGLLLWVAIHSENGGEDAYSRCIHWAIAKQGGQR
jgi:hypothetical protein